MGSAWAGFWPRRRSVGRGRTRGMRLRRRRVSAGALRRARRCLRGRVTGLHSRGRGLGVTPGGWFAPARAPGPAGPGGEPKAPPRATGEVWPAGWLASWCGKGLGRGGVVGRILWGWGERPGTRACGAPGAGRGTPAASRGRPPGAVRQLVPCRTRSKKKITRQLSRRRTWPKNKSRQLVQGVAGFRI